MRGAPLLLIAALGTVASLANANEVAPTETFSGATQAIERGAYDEAIDLLEVLADRGVVHPDASYNRAVAYASRARTPQARPGDLGQAAAALTEALELRPSDSTAERALTEVQREIAHRRSQVGAEPVFVRPTLDRAIVGLAPEDGWALVAAIGSLVLTLGLAVRRLLDKPGTRIGGGIAIVFGSILLVVCASLALGARHLRLETRSGVVVTTEARMLEENGTPLESRDGVPEFVSIPEGALLEVHERKGTLSRFRWGSTEAWVRTSQLRLLAKPD